VRLALCLTLRQIVAVQVSEGFGGREDLWVAVLRGSALEALLPPAH
jgi:hypothetical protein